jgi:predicted RNase H-like HicB family nuclease
MSEKLLRLKVELLPEGVYLATSEVLPGLIAQGRTLNETLEIARDVARKLIESYHEKDEQLPPGLLEICPELEQISIPVGID